MKGGHVKFFFIDHPHIQHVVQPSPLSTSSIFPHLSGNPRSMKHHCPATAAPALATAAFFVDCFLISAVLGDFEVSNQKCVEVLFGCKGGQCLGVLSGRSS